MENRGQSPNEPANKKPQSPQPRIAKGHGEPTYLSNKDQAAPGGGSMKIHGKAGNWSKKGHNEPTQVSAQDLREAMPLDSMLMEQKENQDRNAFTPLHDSTKTKQ